MLTSRTYVVVCEVAEVSQRDDRPFAVLRRAGDTGTRARKASIGGLLADQFEAGRLYEITIRDVTDEPSTTFANDPPPAPADAP